MREIRFRGKSLLKGEWLYGDLTQTSDKKVMWIYQSEAVHTNNFKVIPETVGQYTGLKDKNGVEIYEGDIVQPVGYGWIFEKYQVVYDKPTARFLFFKYINDCLDNELQAIGHSFSYTNKVNDREVETIGNIHDNPGLLK